MHTITSGKPAARRALALLASISLAFSVIACASAPAAKDDAGKKGDKTAKTDKTPKAAEPAWIDNPGSVYPDAKYVSATGYGPDRETAEKTALGSLIAVFGQNVSGETTVSTRYAEAVKSGAIEVTEDFTLDRDVNSTFSLDTVVGAEIKDTWDDGKTYYAVAVLDKAKASITYANLIEKNEETVAKLVDIPASEKDTLDAYARYDLASAVADTNVKFLNLLSVINPAQAAAKRGSVSNGDALRLECLRIAQNIPIGISVEGDRDGRIAAAFASVISDAGFKSGGKNSRYVLNAKMALSPVELANQTNKFSRYTLDSKLTDTATGSVLLPYGSNGREGHATMSEAENRAFRAAEQKIKSEYPLALSGYLSQLTAK